MSDGAPVELRISLYHVPDCPLVARLRDEVRIALERVGTMAMVEEIEGS